MDVEAWMQATSANDSADYQTQMEPSTSRQGSSQGTQEIPTESSIEDDLEPPQYQAHIEPLRVDLLDLPVDVIAHIFYYACKPNRDGKTWRRGFHPLWLGALCRAWREIAWAASELWTTIVFQVHHHPISGVGYPNQKDLLEEWLGRTKGRPLDIIFGSTRYRRRIPVPLIMLLIDHREQWASIELRLPEFWQLAFTADSHPLSFPNLRAVSLHSTKPGNTPTFPDIRLTDAPKLTSLALSGFSIELNDLDRIPRRQITHITLEDCPDISLKTVFTTLTNLQNANFINIKTAGSASITTHERLSSLTITSSIDQFQGGTYQFCRQLTLPALKKLEVCVYAAFPYTSTLGTFLERSACSLTTLKLECHLSQEYDLIDLLYSIPSLQELHLANKSTTTKYLRRAAREVDSSSYPASPWLDSDEVNCVGLGSIFFDTLQPSEATPLLPNLAVFSYAGPLAVQAIDFIDPFIVRSRMRECAYLDMETIAILKKATIKADQYSDVAEFNIAEYSDPQYIWEIVKMIEEGVLVLMNMDGSPWS